MNSLYIHVYTDEDLYGTIARALRERGYDAISTPEAGNIGQTDHEQLRYAISQQRAIVTFNVGDFMHLHAEYLQAQMTHWGIIVSKRLPIGLLHDDALSPMVVIEVFNWQETSAAGVECERYLSLHTRQYLNKLSGAGHAETHGRRKRPDGDHDEN